MIVQAVKAGVVTVAAALLLSACTQGNTAEPEAKADPCDAVVKQTEKAQETADKAVDEYNEFTEGRGAGSQTAEGISLGDDARLAVLTYLHLVVNTPDCFTQTEVAQAQSLIPGWEQPGARPQMPNVG